jgi:hypothetical protein
MEKNKNIRDTDQDVTTHQMLSGMIREQPAIGSDDKCNNGQHEGLSNGKGIVEDEFNPSWEVCLLSFETIRKYMEAHDMTSIVDSFHAVVDSIVKERQSMDEMLNNYFSPTS